MLNYVIIWHASFHCPWVGGRYRGPFPGIQSETTSPPRKTVFRPVFRFGVVKSNDLSAEPPVRLH